LQNIASISPLDGNRLLQIGDGPFEIIDIVESRATRPIDLVLVARGSSIVFAFVQGSNRLSIPTLVKEGKRQSVMGHVVVTLKLQCLLESHNGLVISLDL